MTQKQDNTAYSTIAVAGADAADFLQNQLTADVRELEAGADPVLAAWCNPKGRVIALFHLRREDGTYRLALPAALADDVLRRLTMFRFRSKVDLDLTALDPRDIGLDAGSDLEQWRRGRLEAGIAEIGPAQSEEFTPHMLNLDLLGAVSFDKGCYPGQEIVARTHYRGATKRRMQRYTTAGTAAPGDKVMLGERSVGEVVNTIGAELLAVVPADDAAGDLDVNGAALTLQPLAYGQ